MKDKTIPTADLESNLEMCQRIAADMASVRTLLTNSAAEFPALAASADLSNDATQNQLSKLQTIVTVAPKRLEALQQELFAAKGALLDTAQSFIQIHFAPRCNTLKARALENVERKLQHLFPDQDALRAAAYGTKELSHIGLIQQRAVINLFNPEEAMPYAKELLESWRAADEFEQRELS